MNGNSATRRLFAIALVAAGLSLTACSGDTNNKFGQELFEQVCAVCHGVDGGGTTGRPAIDANSNAATLTDEQIRGVLQVGPGVMPSFSRLTPEQVESLVAYLRQLQSGPAVSD